MIDESLSRLHERMALKDGLGDTQSTVSNVSGTQRCGPFRAIQETFEQLGLESEVSLLEVQNPKAECLRDFPGSIIPLAVSVFLSKSANNVIHRIRSEASASFLAVGPSKATLLPPGPESLRTKTGCNLDLICSRRRSE